jgi:glycosyltransferase involved in cell wall biosynthesis
MKGLLDRGVDVHLVSTFACHPDLPLSSFELVPVAFSGVKGTGKEGGQRKSPRLGGEALVQARTILRQWLGPATLASSANKLSLIIDRIHPDLVHAMRIPFEGMLTARSLQGRNIPLVVSVWGNDFTLHAVSTRWMAHATRFTLERANALHTDCRRDLRLARAWGWRSDAPEIVLPGAGGIQMDLFYPAQVLQDAPLRVINPRGVRAYVRNDTFFQSIPKVLRRFPDTRFICPNMAGDSRVHRWVQELNIQENVELLPPQSRQVMAELFRSAQVAVSPSTHDGTPNTLLEAMACGCFPVVGDLESLREWITPGLNGLLVDPGDADALAQAVISGLENPKLRQDAQQINLDIIAQRAEHRMVMEEAENFYKRILRE